MLLRLALLVVCSGCASTRHLSVDAQVRGRLDTLSAALESAHSDRIDKLLLHAPPTPTGKADPAREHRAQQLAPELTEMAARLRNAARGPIDLRARVRVAGPLGAEVRLDRDEDGWRVDPDTVTLDTSSPRAAVEQLVAALDRLESDPALALLTSELRGELIRNARERAAGLRELLVRLPPADVARSSWPVDLEYGQGLFLRLRVDRGQWRIDDFN